MNASHGRAAHPPKIAARLARIGPGTVGWLVLVALLHAARTQAALDQGRPACDYCRMIFSEPGFGGEIATRSGQRKIYDTVECMAAAVLTDSVRQGDIHAIRLVDHDAPHARITLAHTVFLHCPEIQSPMGLSLLAFASRARADSTCAHHGGRLLDWRGVLSLVDSTWFQGRLAVEPHVGRLGKPNSAAETHPH
jgi:nitrous oxide reductase accessory protein NosL